MLADEGAVRHKNDDWVRGTEICPSYFYHFEAQDRFLEDEDKLRELVGFELLFMKIPSEDALG